MANFYLDHNVSHQLAHALRALGHGVDTAYGLRLDAADDDEQLATAALSGRILVTHNRRDFILLHRAWFRWARLWGVTNVQHHGILMIPDAPRLPTPDAARALDIIDGQPLTNLLLQYRLGPPAHWQTERAP